MRRKRILVTGAAGNIGSELMKDARSWSTMRIHPTPRGEDILRTNIESRLGAVDCVIHLAGLTSVEKSHSARMDFLRVNFEGLKRVADACMNTNTTLLFPSTTSLYSTRKKFVDESSTNLKGYSPYGESKLRAEKYLNTLRTKGLRFSILRLGTVFGYSPGMRFNTAVNKFVWQAIHDIPLTIWKTSWLQKRPYLYIGDCLKAFRLIVDRDEFSGQTYNVLSANHTVKEVISAIRSVVPEVAFEHVDSPSMNRLSYTVSARKIRALGFAPKGTLQIGIQEMVTHFKSQKI